MKDPVRSACRGYKFKCSREPVDELAAWVTDWLLNRDPAALHSSEVPSPPEALPACFPAWGPHWWLAGREGRHLEL